MADVNIYERLRKAQLELKAPKSQYNSFGKYSYRNVEDIIEAAKPVLDKHGLTLVVSDELENIGDRYYIKARATVFDGTRDEGNDDNYISAEGYAREEETKKGMDGAQITGAASSYARKYALNGLLAIDDTKDADSQDNRAGAPATSTPKPPVGSKPTEAEPPASDVQKRQITSFLRALAVEDAEMVGFVRNEYGLDLTNITRSQATQLLEDLK